MLLQTLPLFQTKISDFPQPISDLNNVKIFAPAKEKYLIPDPSLARPVSRECTKPYLISDQKG